MAVRRLLTLLMMMMLTIASGASVSAMCRHGSAQEHVAALESHEQVTASEAKAEEAAAKAAMSDSASLTMAVYLPPQSVAEPRPVAVEAALFRPQNAAMRTGLSPPPLLHPPSV